MADQSAINDALEQALSEPQTVSVNGNTVSARPLADQIAAAEFLQRRDNASAIANGQWPFSGFRVVPPGARGSDASGGGY